MIVESLSVLIILLVMFILFLRAHRKAYAFSTQPLAYVPLIMLLGYPIATFLAGLFPVQASYLHIALILLALIVACVSFGLMTHHFRSRKIRALYVASCGLFTFILTLVFVFYLLNH